MIFPAITIRQPWAALIVSGHKDIENRDWRLPDKFRNCTVLIHSSAKPAFDPHAAQLEMVARGCIRSCPWCVVPAKEGAIRANADISEFCRHRDVKLMDNNVLAHPHGISQIEKMARMDLRVDFNQGLDARLIDDAIARRLAALRWTRFIRLACDQKSQMPEVERAVRLLRAAGGHYREYFCYVLVRDVEDALERVLFLKELNVTPFAQPYRDFTTNVPPDVEQRRFARWVNHKAIFKTVPWKDYRCQEKDHARP